MLILGGGGGGGGGEWGPDGLFSKIYVYPVYGGLSTILSLFVESSIGLII